MFGVLPELKKIEQMEFKRWKKANRSFKDLLTIKGRVEYTNEKNNFLV